MDGRNLYSSYSQYTSYWQFGGYNMEYKPKYEQKISSYKIVFYDMDDNEIEIDERTLKMAYSEIDQAIYEWEQDDN